MAKQILRIVQVRLEGLQEEGMYGDYFKYEFGLQRTKTEVDFANIEHDRLNYDVGSDEIELVFKG